MKHLASELSLVEKIDWDRVQYDTEYSSKWHNVLTKLKVIHGSIPNVQPTLETVDANTFLNWPGIMDELYRNVTEDTDVSQYDFIADVTETKTAAEQRVPNTIEQPTSFYTTHIVDVDYENTPQGAQIFLYTRDLNNRTALIRVPYKDYFYIKLGPGAAENDVRKLVKGYVWYLREKKYPEHSNFDGDRRQHWSSVKVGPNNPKLVVDMEIVTDHKSVYGYQPEGQEFLKVTTSYPCVTVDIFNGLSRKHPHLEFFEAKTDYVNKFLTQYNLSACAPITIKNPVVEPCNTISYCDMLINATVDQIADTEENFPLYTPKYLYYDIECLSLNPDVFPTSDSCPVIQISYLLANGNDEVKRGVLCYKDTPGEFYESFDFEYQMLIRFAQIVLEFNPDFICGYNSNNFDMPYVIDRMKVLGIHFWASQMTRRRNLCLDYKKTVKHSNQFGSRDVISYVTPGRLLMDQFELLKGDATKRLESYALKHVCSVYLKDDNKEDLRYRDIPELFKTVEGRQKIASYCLQDGALLLALEKAIMFGVNLCAMTNVLNTVPNVVANRGLVFKLMCKLKEYTERYNFLIPTFTDVQKPVFEGKYQGAFVLDPDVGYHEDPVVVLDYASLYPSLMIYYNLSYDTIVIDKAWIAANSDKCETMDNGITFVTTDTHFGILPRLEQELGKQRKAAKKKKANAPDGSVEQAIYDGEQNAVKIVMNSLYGMCGSPTATIPCVEIASSITAMGRYNLMGAKQYVEKNYCEFTGEPKEKAAKVVYGDTDSIFIKMAGIDVKKAMEYGKLLEKNITRDLYNKPNALVMEYEKIFCPLLLVTAKRYAGRKYEFDPTKSKLNCNGLQLVKRDAPDLCKDTMSGFFQRALMDSDKNAAGKFVHDQISKLFSDELPLKQFQITKKISKQLKDYTTVPPHIQAWQRQVSRIGPAEAPAVGEQFKFIITRLDKRQKGMGHAMVDYMLAEENHMAKDIDKMHYLRTFIDNPLRLPMKLILGESEMKRILDHKNYARIETVTAKPGNLLHAFGIKSHTTKSKRRFLAPTTSNKKPKT